MTPHTAGQCLMRLTTILRASSRSPTLPHPMFAPLPIGRLMIPQLRGDTLRIQFQELWVTYEQAQVGVASGAASASGASG